MKNLDAAIKRTLRVAAMFLVVALFGNLTDAHAVPPYVMNWQIYRHQLFGRFYPDKTLEIMTLDVRPDGIQSQFSAFKGPFSGSKSAWVVYRENGRMYLVGRLDPPQDGQGNVAWHDSPHAHVFHEPQVYNGGKGVFVPSDGPETIVYTDKYDRESGLIPRLLFKPRDCKPEDPKHKEVCATVDDWAKDKRFEGFGRRAQPPPSRQPSGGTPRPDSFQCDAGGTLSLPYGSILPTADDFIDAVHDLSSGARRFCGQAWNTCKYYGGGIVKTGWNSRMAQSTAMDAVFEGASDAYYELKHLRNTCGSWRETARSAQQSVRDNLPTATAALTACAARARGVIAVGSAVASSPAVGCGLLGAGVMGSAAYMENRLGWNDTNDPTKRPMRANETVVNGQIVPQYMPKW